MFAHLKRAVGYSLLGLKVAVKEEVAFRLVLIQAIMVLILIVFLPLPYPQKAFLTLSASLCLIVEALNSAIENVVDLVTSDWHILAKKAKDLGSAAQFIALLSLYFQAVLILADFW